MSKEQINYRNLKYKTISLDEPAPVEGEVVTDVDTIFVKQVSATEFELYVSDSTGYVVKLERKLDKLTFNDFVREYIENNAPEIRATLERNAVKIAINNEIKGLVLDIGGIKVSLAVEKDGILYIDPRKEVKYIASDNVNADFDKSEGLAIQGGYEQADIPVTNQEEVVVKINPIEGSRPQNLIFVKSAEDKSKYIKNVITFYDNTTLSSEGRKTIVKSFDDGYTNQLEHNNTNYSNHIKSRRNGTYDIVFEGYKNATATIVYKSAAGDRNPIEEWDKTITLDLDTQNVLNVREPDNAENERLIEMEITITDKA